MTFRRMTPVLAVALVLGALAACGAPPPGPVSPVGVPSPEVPGPGASPSAVPSGATSPAPGGTGTAPVASAAPFAMGPGWVPSTLGPDLQALGLDVAKLPPLDKLQGETLRKVMKTFSRALGAKCTDCHAENFAAPTPQKRIAERMWDEFVRGLAQKDGKPHYCDSCHQGRMKFLQHGDGKALARWMDEHYVASVKRTDGKEHNCSTCHGDPFNGDFLEVWAKGPPAKHPALGLTPATLGTAVPAGGGKPAQNRTPGH